MQTNNINNTVEMNFYNPYCFSPLSKRVHFPSWANLISHDIPFEDGISGSINADFEAVSPLIIKEGKENSSSVNINGNYFVPGTSIKGMIRNVLEILSLSKIGSLTSNSRYSLRDLNPANRDYTLKSRQNDIQAGFLIKIKNNYCIIKSPEFESISYREIEEIFEISGYGLKNAKDVQNKYKLIGEDSPFLEKDRDDIWFLVFTGRMQNKRNEYCFKIPNHIEPVPLPDQLVHDFLFIHEKETKSKSWGFWKKKIRNIETTPSFKRLSSEQCFAPVFFTENEDGVIDSLGLAYLFREPYKHRVHDLIPDVHKSNNLDFAECIFGNSENGLKGRVQFSHAFVDMKGKKVNPVPEEIVLGSPKPTFYPFYLKQAGNRTSTFSDENGSINGWKRYLVHDSFSKQTLTNVNNNVTTKIKALPEGVSFSTSIKFHNLKPQELGALMSALTFHNNSDKCFHQIGMGKPLGYGKIKLNNVSLNVSDSTVSPLSLMAMFEKEICDSDSEYNFEQWKKNIKPVFALATGFTNETIRYPHAFDEFRGIKTERLSLVNFSPEINNFELECLNK